MGQIQSGTDLIIICVNPTHKTHRSSDFGCPVFSSRLCLVVGFHYRTGQLMWFSTFSAFELKNQLCPDWYLIKYCWHFFVYCILTQLLMGEGAGLGILCVFNIFCRPAKNSTPAAGGEKGREWNGDRSWAKCNCEAFCKYFSTFK